MPLPPPLSVTDEYLAELLRQVRQLMDGQRQQNDTLQAILQQLRVRVGAHGLPPTGPDVMLFAGEETVELREPAAPGAKPDSAAGAKAATRKKGA